MLYRPDTRRPIDGFFLAQVMRESTLAPAMSPSIHAMDRQVTIKVVRSWSMATSDVVDLSFSSQSYIHFNLGGTYLFAVSGEECVGFLEARGTSALLPNGSSVAIDTFVGERIGRPFPDYQGGDDG
jgi:hypothetical protein